MRLHKADIKLPFPDSAGYSVRNLKYMTKFALLFPNKEIMQTALAQIMYSLKNVGKPIGVSAYQITSNLPEELERQLPSVEDIQKRIKNAKE